MNHLLKEKVQKKRQVGGEGNELVLCMLSLSTGETCPASIGMWKCTLPSPDWSRVVGPRGDGRTWESVKLPRERLQSKKRTAPGQTPKGPTPRDDRSIDRSAGSVGNTPVTESGQQVRWAVPQNQHLRGDEHAGLGGRTSRTVMWFHHVSARPTAALKPRRVL